MAALAILGRVGLPANLETVIDGELLLNDGVAVVLFTLFAATAVEGVVLDLERCRREAFVRELLGGCALGVLGWLVIHHLLPRATDYATGLLVSLAAVAGLYGTALHLHVSGPIATVVAGLLAGNLTLRKVCGRPRAAADLLEGPRRGTERATLRVRRPASGGADQSVGRCGDGRSLARSRSLPC